MLDPHEPLGDDFLKQAPQSELLKPLFKARHENNSKYRPAEIPIQTFVHGQNSLWQSVVLSEEEELLALSYRKGEIWRSCSGSKRVTGLDPGEAETIAVALSRSWGLLIDDQAGVELARILNPNIPIYRTCQFLVQAVNTGLLQCETAQELFNDQMCKRWGFYTKRPKKKEYLRFSCNPARCEWQG